MSGKKLGLTLGSFLALIHLIWVALIAVGLAQPLMDFVYRMHSLNNPFTVMPFDIGYAVGLVVLTFVMGNVVGHIFAFVWHKFHQ